MRCGFNILLNILLFLHNADSYIKTLFCDSIIRLLNDFPKIEELSLTCIRVTSDSLFRCNRLRKLELDINVCK